MELDSHRIDETVLAKWRGAGGVRFGSAESERRRGTNAAQHPDGTGPGGEGRGLT
jgi:hypothetical protein